MLSKKVIIERYLGDLRNVVPQSPARDQRIELLENELEEMKQVNNNDLLAVVTASYFDKIQKGFKKLQEDCTEVRLVGFCQKEDIPDEAHREEFEEEFDHEYQLTQSDGYDEASFWGDIYLQLDDTLYMRFDVIG